MEASLEIMISGSIYDQKRMLDNMHQIQKKKNLIPKTESEIVFLGKKFIFGP